MLSDKIQLFCAIVCGKIKTLCFIIAQMGKGEGGMRGQCGTEEGNDQWARRETGQGYQIYIPMVLMWN